MIGLWLRKFNRKNAWIFLLAVLLVFPLGGCSKSGKSLHPVVTLGLEKNELYRVGDESMSVAQAKVILLTALSGYRDLYGEELLGETFGDKTLEEAVKEDVLSLMGKVTVLDAMAEKYQILLNEEDKKYAAEAAVRFEETLSDAEKEYLQISSEELIDLLEKICLADKVYINLSEEKSIEISDDEARVVVLKQIFLKTTKNDGNGNIVSMASNEKAEVYNQMLSVYEKLNRGGNFDALAKEFSQDETLQYSVSRGELVEPLNSAVFSMETGEVSQILESSAGYHLIFIVNKYDKDATAGNKNHLLAEKQWEQFRETYNEFSKEQNCHLNEKLWATVLEGSEGLSNTHLTDILRNER